MNIFFLLAIAMLIIIIMLRKKNSYRPLYAGSRSVYLGFSSSTTNLFMAGTYRNVHNVAYI